jgi:hypothetical protein
METEVVDSLSSILHSIQLMPSSESEMTSEDDSSESEGSSSESEEEEAKPFTRQATLAEVPMFLNTFSSILQKYAFLKRGKLLRENKGRIREMLEV